jgi:tetratricopeptide (TPR) repeat protein
VKNSPIIFLAIFFICFIQSKSASAQKNHYDPAAEKLNRSAMDTAMNSNSTRKLQSAINLLNQAIKIDSTYFPAYNNKMTFQITIKQYQEAINTGKQMIKLRPNNVAVTFTVGLLNDKIGDGFLAKQYYNKVLTTDNAVLDTMHTQNKAYSNVQLSKALCFIMLNEQQKGGTIIKKLYSTSTDSNYKAVYIQYMNKSKQDILNNMFGPQKKYSTAN